MKIKEVIQFLETKYPLAWQEDFDNCGLQCGNAEQEIKGVLVCFEMSDYTIEEVLFAKHWKIEWFCTLCTPIWIVRQQE